MHIYRFGGQIGPAVLLASFHSEIFVLFADGLKINGFGIRLVINISDNCIYNHNPVNLPVNMILIHCMHEEVY